VSTFASFKAYAAGIRKWETGQRRRAITLGARSGLRLAHRDAMKRFTSHGIGRAIWGRDVTSSGGARKGSNLPTFIKLEKTRWTARGLEGALKAKGLPALVERGGRTRPHTITSKSDGVIKFSLPSLPGGFGFAPKVKHPGAVVPSRPFMRPALEGHVGLIARKIDERLAASVKASGIG